MCDIKAINKIASCLGVPTGDIGYSDEKIVTRTFENQTLTGFTTIVSALSKDSKTEIGINSNSSRVIQAQVQQWIEYSILYVAPGCKNKHYALHLLRDFNALFQTKSYLVGQCLTLADVAIFYTIRDLIESLTPMEKENYINLSRWFDHLQQMPEIRQNDDLINFATIFLHGWATGTHL